MVEAKSGSILRLKQVRKQLKMTQAELTASLELRAGAIKDVEMGRVKLSRDLATQLEKVHNINMRWLLTGENEIEQNSVGEPSLKIRSIPPDDWIEVPVFSRMSAVCAGSGWGHEHIIEEPNKFELFPIQWTGKLSIYPHKRPYIVPVEGDSMEDADIPDGCEILVNPEEPVRDGDAALVRYGPDNDIAVKWVYWEPDGGVEIRSATLKYPPRRFTKEDRDEGVFFVCGKVMKVLGNPKRGA